jgi:hypothetical protein
MDDNFTNLNTAKLESENAGSTGQILTRTSTGANWADAAAGGIADLVEDTTPQLGGALDVNGQQIVSVSNGNIVLAPNGTGKVSISGIQYPNTNGTDGQVLTTNGSGVASWATPAGGGNNVILFASQAGTGVFEPAWFFEGATTGSIQGNRYALVSTGGVSGVTTNLTFGNRFFTLPAGTYVFDWDDGYTTNSTRDFNIVLKDMTNSIDRAVIVFKSISISGTTYRFCSSVTNIFVLSGNTNLRLEIGGLTPSASSTYIGKNTDNNGIQMLRFIKTA